MNLPHFAEEASSRPRAQRVLTGKKDDRPRYREPHTEQFVTDPSPDRLVHRHTDHSNVSSRHGREFTALRQHRLFVDLLHCFPLFNIRIQRCAQQQTTGPRPVNATKSEKARQVSPSQTPTCRSASFRPESIASHRWQSQRPICRASRAPAFHRSSSSPILQSQMEAPTYRPGPAA